MKENAKIILRTTLVTVYLDLLGKTVQQTWMIVQAICAKMVEHVGMALTNIHVNAQRNLPGNFVR